MKVLKFGGTSVGSVESIRSVQSIVASQSEPVIVVVSALGGITDELLETASAAAQGGEGYKEGYGRIVQRHQQVMDGLGAGPEVEEKVHSLLADLEKVYQSIAEQGELKLREKRQGGLVRRAHVVTNRIECVVGRVRLLSGLYQDQGNKWPDRA